MKRIISILLAVMLALSAMPQTLAQANMIIDEDYESYEPGEKPGYGDSGWTGDSMQGKPYNVQAVEVLDGNKVLALKTIGTDDPSISPSWILYRNMKVPATEQHTFSIRARTDNINGTKRLFIRGSSSAQYAYLLQFKAGGVLEILGEQMGMYERGHWYDIKIVMDGGARTVDVYIDGTHRGTMTLSAYNFAGDFSMRWIIEGSSAKDVESSVYIDDVRYDSGSYVSADDDEQDASTDNNNVTAPALTEKESVIVCLNSKKVSINGEVGEIANKPQMSLTKTMLPLRDIANIYGTAVGWDNDTGCAAVEYGDRRARVFSATGEYVIEGANTVTASGAENIDGTMYVPGEFVEALFGKVVTISNSGGIAIADAAVKEEAITNTVFSMVYARPSKADILNSFATTGSTRHPRLVFDSDRLEEIKYLIKNDEFIKKCYKSIRRTAEAALSVENVADPRTDTEDIDMNITILTDVRKISDIVKPCAFVYLIEGDEGFAKRAKEEMMHAAEFANWCPSNFLSTAEMTQCMALGYDWLYSYLTEGERQTIEAAIIQKGLKPAEEAYNGTAKFTDQQGASHNRMMWKEDYSNWGFVCNGGVASGALAIMNDANKDYCAMIVSEAFASSAYPMTVYAPDGAWTEGLGYWGYATEYMSYLLDAAKYTLGTDYNAQDVPGFDRTIFFHMAHIGPQGAFNFGDAGSNQNLSALLHWFADRLSNPALSNIRINMLEQKNAEGGMMDILYYRSADEGLAAAVPSASHYRGTDTAAFIGANHNMANYIAVRGSSAGSHTDLDSGTFVLDALGERWALDHGMESYSVPGYWFWNQNGVGRESYYRKRAEGHNTLVIAPDEKRDQKPAAIAEVDAFESGDEGAYILFDLTDAYSHNGKADSVHRAVASFDNNTRYAIMDSVVLNTPSDVWWFMQTRANIEISYDGKTAILTMGDKHMLVELVTNCKDAVFSWGPAEPLPTSPNPVENAKNTGINRLAVKSPGVTELNMQVIFTPYMGGQLPNGADIPFKSLDVLADGGIINVNKPVYSSLDAININGKPLPGFKPDSYHYSYSLDEGEEAVIVPSVSNGEAVTVLPNEAPQEGKPVSAKIRVSQQGLEESEYYILLSLREKKIFETDAPDAQKLSVASVEASATPEITATPEMTIDGKPSSKWAAEGKQWIKYDLGSEQAIGAIGFLWMDNNVRRQNFSVEVSSDEDTWSTIFDGTASGSINAMEYLLTNAKARYIRVNVNGTSAGVWTSLMEIAFYGEISTQNNTAE